MIIMAAVQAAPQTATTKTKAPITLPLRKAKRDMALTATLPTARSLPWLHRTVERIPLMRSLKRIVRTQIYIKNIEGRFGDDDSYGSMGGGNSPTYQDNYG